MKVIIFCLLFVRFIYGDNDQLLEVDDSLENVSFEDVLSSGVQDRNQNITKKIIDLSAELLSDHVRNYSPIRLKLNTQNFAQGKTISLEGIPLITLQDFNISAEYIYDPNGNRTYSFDTEINCVSSKIVKIVVNLPAEVNITGTFTIFHTSDNSTHKGSFSTATKEGYAIIEKSYFITDNEIHSADKSPIISGVYKIQYKVLDKKSEILIIIDRGIQKKLESLLGTMFEHQLNEEMTTNKKSLALFCSKIVNINQQINHVSTLNDIFVINPKSEIQNGINLTIGPILMNGLTYFNTAILSVRETVNELNTGNNTKAVAIRFIFDELKGKFQWTYNLGTENQTRIFSNQFSTRSTKNMSAIQVDAELHREGGTCNIWWNTRVNRVRVNIRGEKYVNRTLITNEIISESLQTIILNALNNSWRADERMRKLAGINGCEFIQH